MKFSYDFQLRQIEIEAESAKEAGESARAIMEKLLDSLESIIGDEEIGHVSYTFGASDRKPLEEPRYHLDAMGDLVADT